MKMKKKRRSGNMLILVLLCCSFLLFCQGDRAEATAYKAKGIDVSRWQGTVDWTKVKKSGVQFVMLGIGRYHNGQRVPDVNFQTNIKGALSQNIHVGIYLYSEATTVARAKDEADFVLDMIDGYEITYPVAFDIEDEVHRKLTNAQRTDITVAFLEEIEAAGYYPMVYASQSWLEQSLDLTRLKKYDKWVARWASSTSFRPLDMWQYSSTGRVNGINTAVDLDYDYRGYASIVTPRTHALKRRIISGWKTDGTHYWYVQRNGKIPKNCFRTSAGKTYYFDENGYRVSGWQEIDGKTYYFVRNTGVMKKGWLNLFGTRYYLDPVTGQRVEGWLNLDGRKYYLDPADGKLVKGWNIIKGKYYYFNTSTGRMKTGWLTVGNRKYLLRKNGTRASGWVQLIGKWYYFKPSTGVMLRNRTVGRYIFDANGVCTNR